jgi:phosphatidylinositol alpha-1,6-mannosyltransferase
MHAAPLGAVVVTPNACGADGISELTRQIAAALPAPLAIVSLHDADGADVNGIRVAGAGGHRARFCREVARLIPACSSETVVVCVHLHLAPAARLLMWRSARALTMLCGIEAWVPLRPAERWALAASRLVAISETTARRFRDANPRFRSARIAVVHPGLPDRASVVPAPIPPRTALIVGRMAADEAYKGHDALIEIWPDVIARYPDAVLWVAGDGTDRRRLESRVADLALGASVRFAGRVGRETLAGMYAGSSFFVMPSREEGFGFVYLEAMRAGKACIGASGAPAEIIVDGVTGLLVDPGSPTALRAAVLRLFHDDDARERFGKAGRARFLAQFTDASFQDRWARLLEPAVATRSA